MTTTRRPPPAARTRRSSMRGRRPAGGRFAGGVPADGTRAGGVGGRSGAAIAGGGETIGGSGGRAGGVIDTTGASVSCSSRAGVAVAAMAVETIGAGATISDTPDPHPGQNCAPSPRTCPHSVHVDSCGGLMTDTAAGVRSSCSASGSATATVDPQAGQKRAPSRRGLPHSTHPLACILPPRHCPIVERPSVCSKTYYPGAPEERILLTGLTP
jgi:hypothetical protein